jgi:hypothetical protein
MRVSAATGGWRKKDAFCQNNQAVDQCNTQDYPSLKRLIQGSDRTRFKYGNLPLEQFEAIAIGILPSTRSWQIAYKSGSRWR